MNTDATIIETGSGGIATPPGTADRTLIEPATDRDMTIVESQEPGVSGTTVLEVPASGPASSGLILEPGAAFLDYRLDHPLDIVSGEAELWLVARQSNGEKAVLKLYHRGMKPKADVAEAVSKLDTSHVVRIYSRGLTDGAYPRHYEIMEYIVHGSLADMMKTGPLHPAVTRNVLGELRDALEHLHGVNIIHRDIKPSNVLVRAANPLDLVLTDFGISSVSDLSRHLTSANRTAAYSAPEAITGVLSRTCDWWSLGVIVLEMLTGRHPFDGLNEAAVNYELVTRGIQVAPDLPAEWRQLAMGLLTKDDAKRWTGKEVKAWLEGQTNQPVSYAYDDEASVVAKAKQLARPSSFKPYEFQKTEYFDKESLALVLGRAENWDDAVKRVGRGFIGKWLKSFETEDIVNLVLDIEEDNALNADQKLAVMLLVMNAQVPLIWKGEVVTHDWLADNAKTAVALLASGLPPWLKKVRGDDWLLAVRDRRDRILLELKPHFATLPLNEQLARDLVLLPDARLNQLANATWRSLATANDALLQAILDKAEMTEAESIVLLTCDPVRFTTRQQSWAAYLHLTTGRLDDLRRRARTSADFADIQPMEQRLGQITEEAEAEYQTHAQRTEIARNDGDLRQRMTRCQQEIARIPQRAWDAAQATAIGKLDDLRKRARTSADFADIQPLEQRLGQITQEVEAEYQTHAQRTETARNDGDLRQRTTQCQQEIARIPQRAWDAALTLANSQLNDLHRRIAARPAAVDSMSAQQTGLESIQSTLDAKYLECAKYGFVARNDTAVREFLARCCKDLEDLTELHRTLTRFDKLLAARQTTQARLLLEAANGVFLPRDFDLAAAELALHRLIDAYEEPQRLLNVLQNHLAVIRLASPPMRLLSRLSVLGQIKGIFAQVATQRKALAPYANTELAATAETIFSTIERDTLLLQNQWLQRMRRDRILVASVATIAALIMGTVAVIWAVGAVRFRMDVTAFETATSTNQAERAVALAARLRDKYPPAAQLLVARDLAMARRQEAETAKTEAEAAGAATYAKKELAAAAKRVAEANTDFEIGYFNDAAEKSGQALGIYRDAKTMAPLTIHTFVDGQEVSGAWVTINGHKYEERTPHTYRLERDQSYVILVTPDPQTIIGMEYAPFTTTHKANTSGPQELKVELELQKNAPAGCRAAAGTTPEPYTNTGWAKEIMHEATGIAMVYVPAGVFTMGSPGVEPYRGSDETRHQVTLTKGFYMGKYEVTQGQWEKVMGSNPAKFQNGGKNAPVESVSWDECQEFCKKLGAGFRLQTEAEWEYACRAGTTSAYAGELDEMGWYAKNRADATHPVGQKTPNPWGLYDMHGNVWEWCQDWNDNIPRVPVIDPTGPEKGTFRVIRGGGWDNPASYARSAYRNGSEPGRRNSFIGFRLALSPAGQ